MWAAVWAVPMWVLCVYVCAYMSYEVCMCVCLCICVCSCMWARVWIVCTIRLLIKLIIFLVPKRNLSAVAEFSQDYVCSENRREVFGRWPVPKKYWRTKSQPGRGPLRDFRSLGSGGGLGDPSWDQTVQGEERWEERREGGGTHLASTLLAPEAQGTPVTGRMDKEGRKESSGCLSRWQD